jgi:hypothetical protein
VINWTTVADLATAGGTLVLAIATFSSVRSGNRSARVAEQSLLTSMRPLLMPSRQEDAPLKVGFGDDHWVYVKGGSGTIEVTEENIYLTMSLRNAGNGIAVLHGWEIVDSTDPGHADRPDVSNFRRLTRDIYISAGDVYFWQGAIRDVGDAHRAIVAERHDQREGVVVDVLYSDQHGGQRMVARFRLTPRQDGDHLLAMVRQWNIDDPDPR